MGVFMFLIWLRDRALQLRTTACLSCAGGVALASLIWQPYYVTQLLSSLKHKTSVVLIIQAKVHLLSNTNGAILNRYLPRWVFYQNPYRRPLRPIPQSGMMVFAGICKKPHVPVAGCEEGETKRPHERSGVLQCCKAGLLCVRKRA